MSKRKMIGIGLAGVLSVVSACSKSDKVAETESTQAKQVQVAVDPRQKEGRENIALSYVARQKDYVKSINCLLSLYQQIIPSVKANASSMGIGAAMHQAYAACRMKGIMKENSIAYNFDDIVTQNYAAGTDIADWEKNFTKAGQEAEQILSEGDKICRTWVPSPLTGKKFLRRDFVENVWQTADEFETWNSIRESQRNRTL